MTEVNVEELHQPTARPRWRRVVRGALITLGALVVVLVLTVAAMARFNTLPGLPEHLCTGCENVINQELVTIRVDSESATSVQIGHDDWVTGLNVGDSVSSPGWGHITITAINPRQEDHDGYHVVGGGSLDVRWFPW